MRASVAAAHKLSCSMTCGIFLDQGLNPCLLHWQAASLPLSHQGSLEVTFMEHLLYTSLVAQRLKCLPGMRDTWVWSLSLEDPLEKELVTHSSTLAWGIPWREEPGTLQWGCKESDMTERLHFHFHLLYTRQHSKCFICITSFCFSTTLWGWTVITLVL